MRIILSFLTLSFCLSCAPGSHMSGAESELDRRTEQTGSTLSFIGATSRDMMLAPPSGFFPSGERIVGTDNNLGLVAGQADNGRWLLLLDRTLDDGSARPLFRIEDELWLVGVTFEQVAWDDCTSSEHEPGRLVAVIPRDSSCDMPTAAERAWLVDTEAARFVAIESPTQVRCKRVDCPRDPKPPALLERR